MAYPDKVKQRAIELANEGYSPGAIINSLKREFPPEDIPLDERTIRRWRSGLSTKLDNPESSNFKINDEHRDHLLEIINLLLENEVGKVLGYPSQGKIPETDDYTIISAESDFEKIPQSYLVERIENNIELFCKTYSAYDFWDCFIPHLMAETDRDDFNKFYSDHPIEFINLLRMLAQRKEFKGSCPVCEDN